MLRGAGDRRGGPKTLPASSTPSPRDLAATHREIHAALPGYSLPAALLGFIDCDGRVPAAPDVVVKPVARYT